MGRKSGQRFIARRRASSTGQTAGGAVLATPAALRGAAGGACLLSGSPVIISEILAGKTTGIVDSSGKAPADWLEIQNTSSTQTVNLSGWQVVVQRFEAWTFPTMNLGPCESRVIFCDPNIASETDPLGELNTGFSLGTSGKDLVLLDNSSRATRSTRIRPIRR